LSNEIKLVSCPSLLATVYILLHIRLQSAFRPVMISSVQQICLHGDPYSKQRCRFVWLSHFVKRF